MQDQPSAPPPRIEPLLLSITDAAKALGIHPATARELVAAGVIPSVRVRSRRLIRTADLCAYVAALPVASPGGDA